MPREVGATSAWISTSSGRVPSIPANTTVPGLPRSRSERKSSDGSSTPAQARARHLEHADLVRRAEAVFEPHAGCGNWVRAFAFERQHRVDHVLDHARARDLAVLGHVLPTRMTAPAPERLAKRISACARATHLRDCAGRGSHRVGPHGLDRIDDDQPGDFALAGGRDDVFDRSFGGEFDQRPRRCLHALVVGAVLRPSLLAQRARALRGKPAAACAPPARICLAALERDARRHLDEDHDVAFVELRQELAAEPRTPRRPSSAAARRRRPATSSRRPSSQATSRSYPSRIRTSKLGSRSSASLRPQNHRAQRRDDRDQANTSAPSSAKL